MGAKEVTLDNNYWQERALSGVRAACGADINYAELEKLSKNFKELYSRGCLEKIASISLNNFLKEKHLDNYKDPNTEAKKLTLMQCIEVFGDYQVVFPSYGIFMPSYKKALSSFDSTDVHNSLLVGVLNKNTITEYNYLMNNISPKGTRFIMDNNPCSEVLDYKHFIFDDALKMSLPGNQFDSLQINFVIDEIPREVQGNLFSEAYRVLVPNGKFVMVEMKKDVDFGQLENKGFRSIEIEEAPFYNKRRELIDVMENKAKPQPISCPEIVLVTAMK